MVRERPSSGHHRPCSGEFQVSAWLGHSTVFWSYTHLGAAVKICFRSD